MDGKITAAIVIVCRESYEEKKGGTASQRWNLRARGDSQTKLRVPYLDTKERSGGEKEGKDSKLREAET